VDARAEAEFTRFVADRTVALLRAAHALTGDQHAAEDLVQNALAKAMLRWRHIEENPEAYVRRILYHDHISGWRKRRRRPETPMAVLPESPDADGTDGAHLRMLLRAALLELPPGRAPPQGALLSVIATVEEPRGPSHGFDERTWLRRHGVHVVLRASAWRVVRVRGGLARYELAPEQEEVVRTRLDDLRSRIDEEPKNAKWRLRARVGERVKWYEEPEEVG